MHLIWLTLLYTGFISHHIAHALEHSNSQLQISLYVLQNKDIHLSCLNQTCLQSAEGKTSGRFSSFYPLIIVQY